jgi:hypothetical protein
MADLKNPAFAKFHANAEKVTLPQLVRTFAEAVDTLVNAHAERGLEIQALRQRLAEIETKGIRYAGVWQRALEYARGSVVTHGGSAWVALADNTKGEPGSNDAWQLMVKKGADAK